MIWKSFLLGSSLAISSISSSSFSSSSSSSVGGIYQDKKISFDGRSFLINGHREMLIGGCIHYPRAHYSEWAHIFSEAKAQGINLLETYVFWDLHEPSQGQYYFPDYPSSANLVSYIQLAQEHGLYVHLRFGPYVCAEWNYGGLPVWLREIGNGTSIFRTTDSYWMTSMTSFIDKTLEIVSEAKLFVDDGGPIIMVQIENEFGNIEAAYGDEGAKYVSEVANYALAKNLDVPWVMCQQGEGIGTAPPAEIINACNGHYCDNWISRHASDFPNQPHMWTENWPGWFQKWGEPAPHRPATDVSFAVARWFARGGSFVSYYMAFGGTNFGRSVGGPQIVTSYDYDVQINEYGLRNEPKFSLLQQLHEIIYSNQDTLLNQMPPTPYSFGSSCEVHVYSDDSNCLAFLSNWNQENNCLVDIKDDQVLIDSQSVIPWSVTIMKGTGPSPCEFLKTIYNTKSSVNDVKPENQLYGVVFEEVKFKMTHVKGESIPSSDVPTLKSVSPLEQLSVTKDSSDYLWYSTQIESDTTTGSLSFGIGGAGGEIIYLYINGQYQASSLEVEPVRQLKSTPISFNLTVPIGSSRLDILSVSMGLNNYGAHMEENQVGIISSVTFNGKELTDFTHSIGLSGESLPLQSGHFDSSSLNNCSELCWYHLQFPTPPSYQPSEEGLSTIALDLGLSDLSKGILYVNGHMIGRFWTIMASDENSATKCEDCDELTYSGQYSGAICRRGCGEMSQRYYKIPYQWLHSLDSGLVNELVILDEHQGTPSGIQLVDMKMEPRDTAA